MKDTFWRDFAATLAIALVIAIGYLSMVDKIDRQDRAINAHTQKPYAAVAANHGEQQ